MPVCQVSLATGAAHFAAMRKFYLAALAPVGYVTFSDQADRLGLMTAGNLPDFWLHVGNGEQTAFPAGGDVQARPGRTQVSFDGESPDVVDKYYAAAIKAGGVCNGKPGFREAFSKPYYAAFVLDPLGNNIEVVHYPEPVAALVS
ncbi:hypothetical protein F5Y19DRAFT_469734 [Xylariaceae sp. FL1651]|nr:hypothetical protein F5Y19DRAFT_469734 [Xylariaceae sp. FL1651]